MPTSHEFDRAAALLDLAADDLGSLVAPAEAALGPEVVSGGRLALVIDVTLSESRHSAETCAQTLRSKAELCRYRAAVCRQYHTDLNAFQRDRDIWEPGEGSQPERPRRTHSWID